MSQPPSKRRCFPPVEAPELIDLVISDDEDDSRAPEKPIETAQIKTMSQLPNEKPEEIGNFSKLLADNVAELERARRQILYLWAKVRGLRNELQYVTTPFDRRTLTAQLEVYRHAESQLRITVDDLRIQLADARGEAAEAKAWRDENMEANETLREQLAAANGANAAPLCDAAEVQNVKDELTAALQAKETLRRQVADFRQELLQQEKVAERLRTELTAAKGLVRTDDAEARRQAQKIIAEATAKAAAIVAAATVEAEQLCDVAQLEANATMENANRAVPRRRGVNEVKNLQINLCRNQDLRRKRPRN